MVQMTSWRYCSNFYNIEDLPHSWNMRHGVKTYMNHLKSILMWNIWILEYVGIISSSAYSSFLMALQDVPCSPPYIEETNKWMLHRNQYHCVLLLERERPMDINGDQEVMGSTPKFQSGIYAL